ncbi:hypothetical protein L3X38_009065 [Prunus dulcis]|uniref:Uncharacterized protein n=1 Tax=Prunus dulcis TaxID=3755 RepID=A0AAD4ZXM1_PRUDU|nr:hypothetical protein L3X38_009065 [Prunus dulcis]
MKWEKADWDPKVDPGPHGRASSGEKFVFRFRRAAPLARPVTPYTHHHRSNRDQSIVGSQNCSLGVVKIALLALYISFAQYRLDKLELQHGALSHELQR